MDGDLCQLVRPVYPGVPGIGFQTLERPVLDRVRGEAEGHGCFLDFVWPGLVDSSGVDSGPGLQLDFLDPGESSESHPVGRLKRLIYCGLLQTQVASGLRVASQKKQPVARGIPRFARPYTFTARRDPFNINGLGVATNVFCVACCYETVPLPPCSAHVSCEYA
jgi:hypothetical protein